MTRNWYRRLLFVGVGVWIGGVLAVLFGTGAVVLELGPWWVGVAIALLSGTVGGVAGGRATYDRSMHERVHGPLGVTLFIGVPVAMLVVVLASIVLVSSLSDAVTASLLAGAVGSTVGGFLALLANLPLWKATLQASSTAYASWTARRPPAQRRRSKYAAGVFAVVAVGYIAVTFLLELDFGTTNWWVVFAPLSAVIASADAERSVEVLDSGVLVDSTLVAWSDYEDFELTEEALVVHRSGRFFERADRFDRADVDDLDAAVSALERSLPRREH